MRSMRVLAVAISIAVFLMMFFPAWAAFTVPPTMDLTTSSSCSGATDPVYTFHAENPNAGETVVAFSVPIPSGYSVDPAYLTTTPGIVVMTGTYGPIGTTTVNGILRLETTSTVGQFTIIATNTNPPIPPVQIGQANLVPPTSTAATWTVTISPTVPNNGEYIELAFVAGFFINPTSAGVYTWGPATAVPSAGLSVIMNPRIGYTNQVQIVSCAVGGVAMPANTLALVAPWLAVLGLFCIGTIAIVAKKYR